MRISGFASLFSASAVFFRFSSLFSVSVVFFIPCLFRKVDCLEELEILKILENSRLWKTKENPTFF